MNEIKPNSTNDFLVESPFDSNNTNELAVLAREFNNNVNNELSTIKVNEVAISKAKVQMNLDAVDVGSISALAKVTIDQNPTLTNEQIATRLLEKLATEHPNKFIRNLSKKMVKNKWGERHGG